MGKIDDFFRFEIDNRLFDRTDNYGLHPWEAVRYHVCTAVIGGAQHVMSNPRQKGWKTFIKDLLVFVVYLMRHKYCKYMFIMSSRDRIGNEFYDKIANDMYVIVNRSRCFTIDTLNHGESHSVYKDDSCSNVLMVLLRRFPWKCYTYKEEHFLLSSTFPGFSMTQHELENLYREFIVQYFVYKFLLRFCHVRKVFIVQNGIHKGLFAAANKLGVEVLEFQHGQISRNHTSYSYPEDTSITSEKLYHPNKLLTFGSFWNKNRIYPGVENVVLGNNSYAYPFDYSITNGNRTILVVANKDDGIFLNKFVKDILTTDDSFRFLFKLHPNQYKDYNSFCKLFVDCPQVEVVTDGKNISQLLSVAECILVVQSTVELEALRVGRKVFVIKYGAYELMDFVFEEKGVYLIKNSAEFLDLYNKTINEKLPQRDDLFAPFDKNIARSLM